MEEKLRFTRDTLDQFHTVEDVAMFATTMMFSVIPAGKVALAVIEGSVLKSVSTVGERVNTDLNLDQPRIHARAIKTGQTQLVNDTREDPDHLHGDGGDSPATLSKLCVPLIHGGKALGTIDFENRGPGRFSEEEAKTAEAFAGVIAGAVDRVREEHALVEGSRVVYQVKARSAMDRYHDLLKAVYEGETVLNMMLNRTAIPWKPGKSMVDDLVTKGYLIRERSTARRYVYRITEEGVKAMETYKDIVEKLGK